MGDTLPLIALGAKAMNVEVWIELLILVLRIVSAGTAQGVASFWA